MRDREYKKCFSNRSFLPVPLDGFVIFVVNFLEEFMWTLIRDEKQLKAWMKQSNPDENIDASGFPFFIAAVARYDETTGIERLFRRDIERMAKEISR